MAVCNPDDKIIIFSSFYENYGADAIFSGAQPLFARTLSCSSLSKTYAITGWHLGYVVAPAQISAAVRKVHDFLTVGAAVPQQEAAVTALDFPDSYYRQLQAEYTRRRELLLGDLEQTGLRYDTPQGACYVLFDISDFSFHDDTDFCFWMARGIGIAAVPGSSFFDYPVHNLVRLNFAKRDDTLAEVGARLQRLKRG